MAFGTPAPGAAIARSAHNFMQNLSPGGQITNVLTFLRFLPGFINSNVHDEAMRVDIEDRVWVGAWEKAKQAYADGTLPESYAKYWLDNGEKKTGLNEEEALHGVAMMATVSILTIIAPLQRWLVIMADHPEWQKRVQDEMEQQLEGRMVDYADSPRLPVLRATILESLRWASPVPTGIPHRLEEDMVYNGYHLSKDSNVLACDWAMCRSPDLYDDPDTFNPDRWLNSASPCYREPLTEFPKIQGHSVFGWGRRVCIGQDYAATQLLVVCGAVSYSMNIKKALDKDGKEIPISLDNSTPNVIPIMEPVELDFLPRSAEKSQYLRDQLAMYKQHDGDLDECA